MRVDEYRVGGEDLVHVRASERAGERTSARGAGESGGFEKVLYTAGEDKRGQGARSKEGKARQPEGVYFVRGFKVHEDDGVKK